MFGQDVEFHTIYRDGSYDDKIIDHEEVAEYLASLSRAHLSNSVVFSSFDGDAHRIEIRPADALRYRDGCVVGYVYSTIAPTRLVDSLADVDAVNLGRGEFVYATLGDNWYLFIERPNYSD